MVYIACLTYISIHAIIYNIMCKHKSYLFLSKKETAGERERESATQSLLIDKFNTPVC